MIITLERKERDSNPQVPKDPTLAEWWLTKLAVPFHVLPSYTGRERKDFN